MQVPRPRALVFWARFALVVIGEAVVAEMMLSSKGVASLLVALVELGELFGTAELSWNAERWTAGRAGGLLVSCLGSGGRVDRRPLVRRPVVWHTEKSIPSRDVTIESFFHDSSQRGRWTRCSLVCRSGETLHQRLQVHWRWSLHSIWSLVSMVYSSGSC